MPSAMHAIHTTTLADLDGVLTKIGAKMTASEVHALYLGALTSTSPSLGPQSLIDRILSQNVGLGDNPMDTLGVVLGYWNTLVAERDAGRVRLAPMELPVDPSKVALLAFAARRNVELDWYVCGIDAGGDDPMEFGPEGQNLLDGIAEGSAFLQAYVNLLERLSEPSAKDRRDARKQLLEVVATVERLIADLMDVSDAVRREALATTTARAGRDTDDGVRSTMTVKVGRNEKCPCGSGKKWKKCCGAPERMQ